MKLNKIKEFLVRIILNDPDFKIADDKEDISQEENKKADSNANNKENTNTTENKKTGKNPQTDSASSEKKKSKVSINIYLGIIVLLSLCFYIVSDYIAQESKRLNIEYNAYFSEIDMTERTTQSPFPININTASVEEIMLLPDIGSTKAKLIVIYRTENGTFKQKEELLNISGIGDKTFENIKDLIVIE